MVKRPTCSEPITLETCKSEPAEDVQGCSSEMLPFAASCEPICVADVLKQHAVLADAAMLKRGPWRTASAPADALALKLLDEGLSILIDGVVHLDRS